MEGHAIEIHEGFDDGEGALGEGEAVIDGEADGFGHLAGERDFGDGAIGEVLVEIKEGFFERGGVSGGGCGQGEEGIGGPGEVGSAEGGEHFQEAAREGWGDGFDVGVVEEPEGFGFGIVVDIPGMEVTVKFAVVEEVVTVDSEEGEEGFVGELLSGEEATDGGGGNESRDEDAIVRKVGMEDGEVELFEVGEIFDVLIAQVLKDLCTGNLPGESHFREGGAFDGVENANGVGDPFEFRVEEEG